METKFNEVTRDSGTDKLKPCSCKCGKSLMAILIILIVGIFCWHVHRPKPSRWRPIDLEPGTMCTVQFRRDVLGAATTLPVSPTANSINGSTVSIQGELVAVTHEAILLDQVDEHYIVNDVPRMQRFWIPKSSILSIEYESARTFLDLPKDNMLRIRYEVKKQHQAAENQ